MEELSLTYIIFLSPSLAPLLFLSNILTALDVNTVLLQVLEGVPRGAVPPLHPAQVPAAQAIHMLQLALSEPGSQRGFKYGNMGKAVLILWWWFDEKGVREMVYNFFFVWCCVESLVSVC